MFHCNMALLLVWEFYPFKNMQSACYAISSHFPLSTSPDTGIQSYLEHRKRPVAWNGLNTSKSDQNGWYTPFKYFSKFSKRSLFWILRVKIFENRNVFYKYFWDVIYPNLLPKRKATIIKIVDQCYKHHLVDLKIFTDETSSGQERNVNKSNLPNVAWKTTVPNILTETYPMVEVLISSLPLGQLSIDALVA